MTQLAYQVPDTGRKKTILRIPESHTLYLCPNSCGRRQGIRALKNGQADCVSFLSFTQAEVALGDYLARIDEAVDMLLATLEPAPRVLTLSVNCVDDFLGTDTDALLAGLAARHPETRFLLSRINPVAADVAGPAGLAIHTNLYAALDAVPPEARDRGLNVVGGFLPASQGAPELVGAACGLGAGPVRDLVSCATFSDYAAMAKSALNLSVSRVGDAACEAMRDRLGIPWASWHACYDLDEIERRYRALAEELGQAGARGMGACVGGRASSPVEHACELAESGVEGVGARAAARADASVWELLAQARSRAERAVAQARLAVGDVPLVVDTSASLVPFSLALALLSYGFNVAAVLALHSKGDDGASERALGRDHPEVRIVRSGGMEAFGDLGLARPCLGVGHDAAFLVRAEHEADVYHDEGLFGFAGVEALMGALCRAMGETKVWEG